jgi:hypothetical protein
VSVQERCPSCGALIGEIVRIRYEGRLTHVRFLQEDDDGEPAELDHVCGDT